MVLECSVCGYVLDLEKGDPEHGIAQGTRREEIPDNWECPECSATIQSFVVVEE